MENVYVVENGVEAKEKIDSLTMVQGFDKDNIYILAHEEERTESLTEQLDINDIGMKEEGFMDTVTNPFRSKGDELRNKFENLGLTKEEAEEYETELDKGRLVIIAKH